MDNTDMLIGQMLDDRYEILEKIGSGGMAVVYKAKCHRLNRLVAVKVLKGEYAQTPDFKKRFQVESQAVAMLSDPNIVSVYDVNTSGNTDYIVMELIEGITLKQYINRKGFLSWKETLHFSTQIAKALRHAHSKGIVHRDIKPHNIMLLTDGSVKVTDFGIAALSNVQSTLTQEAMGSVHYISPEQAQGAQADQRSDIYSLGVVMYEMLTGRLPFEGDTAVSVAIQHISSIPLMPREINPDIPEGLEDIAMHAMEADISNRYQSAEEMLRDLDAFRQNPNIIFDYISASKIGSTLAENDGTARFIPVSAPPVQLNSSDRANRDKISEPIGGIGAPSAKKRVTQETKPLVHLPKATLQDGEYSRNRRDAGKTALLIGILLVSIFLVFLFSFMWRYFLKDVLNPSAEQTYVPKFVGQMLSDVRNNEEYTQYFNFNVELESSNEFESGYIMAQSPSQDRKMTVLTGGIDVTLTVSSGVVPYNMPNLINRDYREADVELRSYQLNLDIHFEAVADETVPAGTIISQIPEADELLTYGGSVYITYSSGSSIVTVTVPNVVGLTEGNAIRRLQSYDLTYAVEYVDSDEPEGEVIFQSYEVDREVPVSTQIVITVSSGPAPTPTPTPSPEPTPTPSDDDITVFDPWDISEDGDNSDGDENTDSN